ncbi:zinc finger MYM-type protein [Salix suchowensis]|nr:zinc finger MYM-type protein [Salix suchowensis]
MVKGGETQVGVPVIIAMKGHPGTGKSTLASSLASSLKIPLIDKDDVRDCTISIQNSSPATASKLLNDLSYDVVWQIASTQLRLGLSVIVDSPLSRRAHLDRLVQVASSTGSLLVIVECKPLDEGVWRRRLEQRGRGDQASWHKPSTWQDLERLLEGYDGSTDYDVGDVPKLVLDTSVSVAVDELVSRVVDFVVSSACTDYHSYN